MKTVAPAYYPRFRCIAGACRHTCCAGWEIGIDPESLRRFRADPGIAPFVEEEGAPRIRLLEGERCPFLREDGLCEMILTRGEESLCQICRDHPRFRNYWTDRIETGLGLVCEEAARLILSSPGPMRLITLEDGPALPLPPEEKRLRAQRDALLRGVRETRPRARLKEYLIYRHLAGALRDGRLNARLSFIRASFREITALWDRTDGSLPALCEAARAWSYDAEYDDEELERRLRALDR